MEYDDYVDYAQPDMVTTVMLIHVKSSACYRIDANLALISYTKLDAKTLIRILKVRAYVSKALLQSYVIQSSPPNKHCISLESFYFSPVR